MADSIGGEIRDQTAHIVAAVIILAPAMVWPSIPSFAWAGFWIGAVREVTELRTPFTMEKLHRAIVTSKLDLTFWTTGAAFAALFFGV
jgi:hypothetical protein